MKLPELGVQKPVTEVLPKDWDWTVGINAQSILWGAQRAVPLMERHGWGRIITVTSIGSTRVYPDYAIVGVSKSAIETLTRYLAVELASRNIIVNAVSPGVVETEALNFFPSKDQMIGYGKQRTPADRLVGNRQLGLRTRRRRRRSRGRLVGRGAGRDAERQHGEPGESEFTHRIFPFCVQD